MNFGTREEMRLMEMEMTLHDFVLKLLVDPGARAEFELDPEGALAGAGLGDITAADVQEVIPLVVDYAPIDGVNGLVAADALTTGLASDPTSAVGQLQGFTQHLPLSGASSTGVDLNVGATAVAGVSLNLGQLAVSPITLPGLGGIDPIGSPIGVPGVLSAISDPANTIDDLGPIGVGVSGPVNGGVGVDPVGGIGSTGVGGVTGTVDGLTGGLTGGLTDPLRGVTGSVGGVTGPVTGAVDGVTSPVHGMVDPTVSGVFGVADVTVGTVSGVTGTVGLDGLTGTGVDAHAAGAVTADPMAASTHATYASTQASTYTGADTSYAGAPDPTAATHTGSMLPDLGHTPVGDILGGVQGATDGGITDIL
jgi:hypothetical protein